MREKVEKLTIQAGTMLRDSFKKPDLKIFRKEDGSPVTEVDYAVSDFLMEALAPLGIPVVTEEKQPEKIPQGDFWIIDPLDGTQYFIDQAPHFAVLIALISGGKPVMGFSYFPIADLFFVAEKGKGSFLNGQRITHENFRKDLIAYSSGFHQKPQAASLMQELNIKEVKLQESVLKMCYMARGDADFYPRFGPTYEWDTASGQILLEEAGCRVISLQDLEPLQYGKADYLNHGFLCYRHDLDSQVQKLFKDFLWKRDAHGPRHKD